MEQTTKTAMRKVSIVWADELPEFYQELRRDGYIVELGAGNHWEDAYHYIGRPISTDAPKEILVARLLDMMEEDLQDAVAEGDISGEMAQEIYNEQKTEVERNTPA